jgi:hypothetical protein
MHFEGDQTPFSEAIERPMSSHGGIPGMRSFVITLSGYTSRTQPTRDQVQIAISATGACMLPVLSRTHSTHLLCYEPAGEKFKKAKSWRFENILSHKVRRPLVVLRSMWYSHVTYWRMHLSGCLTH